MFTRKNREPSAERTEIRNNATGKTSLAKGVITPFITLKNLILDNTWVGLIHGILVLFSIIAMPHSQSIAGPRYEPIWLAPFRGFVAIPTSFVNLENSIVMTIYAVIFLMLPFILMAYFTAKMNPGRDGIRSLTILAVMAIILHGLHAYTNIVYRINPLTATVMLTLLLYVPVVGIVESVYARTVGKQQSSPRRREKAQPPYNRTATEPVAEKPAAKAQPDLEPANPQPKPAPPPRRPRVPAEPPPPPRAARPPASPLGQ